MKPVQYFDGHIVINLFGIMVRIKKSFPYKCPEVKECGVNKLPPHPNPLPEEREYPIVVSLTSFPERINIVVKTIKTLLTQTMKPDVVVLWLAPEQFPGGEKDLPEELLKLKDFGLTIDWYKDIRSYKKIIPALKKYPDSIIITTDDDIYYAPDTVETLYKSYLEHKDEVHAHRCDWLKVKKSTPTLTPSWIIRGVGGVTSNLHLTGLRPTENPLPAGEGTLEWEKTRELYLDRHRGQSSFRNRLTGYGAVLYPPNCFYKDCMDEGIFRELIPTHDDVWLWAMATLNGCKTRLVKGYSESINYVEDSQQYGLCKVNKKGVGMSLDEAYKVMLKKYPQILEILEAECI